MSSWKSPDALTGGSFPFGLPWWFRWEVSHVGDLGSIPGTGRSPGEGNGNPLQKSCLENPMDGGAWQAMVHEVAKSQTQLSDFTFTSQVALVVKNLPTNAGDL